MYKWYQIPCWSCAEIAPAILWICETTLAAFAPGKFIQVPFKIERRNALQAFIYESYITVHSKQEYIHRLYVLFHYSLLKKYSGIKVNLIGHVRDTLSTN